MSSDNTAAALQVSRCQACHSSDRLKACSIEFRELQNGRGLERLGDVMLRLLGKPPAILQGSAARSAARPISCQGVACSGRSICPNQASEGSHLPLGGFVRRQTALCVMIAPTLQTPSLAQLLAGPTSRLELSRFRRSNASRSCEPDIMPGLNHSAASRWDTLSAVIRFPASSGSHSCAASRISS